jgi:hypothetical protein
MHVEQGRDGTGITKITGYRAGLGPPYHGYDLAQLHRIQRSPDRGAQKTACTCQQDLQLDALAPPAPIGLSRASGPSPSRIMGARLRLTAGEARPVRDLALLELEFIPEALSSLKLASNAGVKGGDDVHAIGHPTDYTWTYTKRFVSQIRLNYEVQFRTLNERLEHGLYHFAAVSDGLLVVQIQPDPT